MLDPEKTEPAEPVEAAPEVEPHPWAHLDWMECTRKIRASPHFMKQARKVYPAYRLLHGDLDSWSEDEFLHHVAEHLALFITADAKEQVSDRNLKMTANYGGMSVGFEDIGLGGPNYRIILHGPTVTDMRMVHETPESVARHQAYLRGEDIS